jgi:hypothetical protein
VGGLLRQRGAGPKGPLGVAPRAQPSDGRPVRARALQQLDPERTEIALINDPGRTAVDFLREVLYQLGEETATQDRTEILHRIHEVLNGFHTEGKETIVVIDEGQLMEDPAVLEEIRLLVIFQLNDAFLINYAPGRKRAACRQDTEQPAAGPAHRYPGHLDTAGAR